MCGLFFMIYVNMIIIHFKPSEAIGRSLHKILSRNDRTGISFFQQTSEVSGVIIENYFHAPKCTGILFVRRFRHLGKRLK